MSGERERWRRVEAALGRVLEAAAGERPAVLEAVCGDDVDLRREVEELVAAAARSAFFDGDAASFAAPAFGVEELPAERLGAYRLIREIGAGGMSRVFLAEREGGEFEQRVAIKVLRAVGLDLAEGAGRFRAERQILASLEHASIARVFDGGATAAGLPYLVMELIDGVTITEHCAGLDLDERLELLIEACDAVQYAHQRLIVHRDLKPSNILVTRDGRLKLLDFGIAKLLDPETLGLDLAAPVTRTGLLLMTPEYAAPEQILGETVTTATDVYALGVLLYELLTGRRPFDLAGKSASQIEGAVCREEPKRPSTLASTAGGETDRKLSRRLHGDLDTIVLKALRKEPAERYDSARALADDLRRFREGLPITARPATFGYRARKFVARHRLGVAAAALAMIAVVGFVWALAAQQRQTARERDRAVAAAERARLATETSDRVTDFVQGVFATAFPGSADSPAITAAELLANGLTRAEEELGEEPAVHARVLDVIARVYNAIGEADKADELLDRALAISRETYSGPHENLATALNSRGVNYSISGRWDDAAPLLAEALAMRREVLEPRHPKIAETLNSLGFVRIREGRYDEAEELLRESIDIYLESYGRDHAETARSLEMLGGVYYSQGRFGEASERFRQVTAIREELQGADSLDAAFSKNTLALTLVYQGELEEAEALSREVQVTATAVLGPDHEYTHHWRVTLGRALAGQGKLEQAEGLLVECVAAFRALPASRNHRLAASLMRLAEVQLAQERLAAAAASVDESIAIYETRYGETAWQPALARSVRGAILAAGGQFEAAEPLLLASLETVSESRGEGSPAAREVRAHLRRLYREWDKPAEGAKFESS